MSKKCLNCNNILEDSVEFCPECGKNEFEAIGAPAEVIDNAPTETTETAEVETYEASDEAVEAEVPAEPAEFPAAEVAVATKKKKKWWKIAIFTVIPLALVLAIVLNMSSIMAFAIKTFGSNDKYYNYIEEKNIETCAKDVAKAYDEYLTKLTDGTNVKTKVNINVGEDLQRLLKSSLATEIDMNWVNNLSFSLDTNLRSDKQLVNLGLLIDNKNFLTAKAILDMTGEKVYITLPELSNKVIESKVDVEDSVTLETALKCAPKAEVVEKLIKKYLTLVVDNIDNIEKSQETVKVKDIEQKVTVLEYNIDNKKINEISTAVLKELKADTDVKAIFEKIDAELDKNTYKDFIEKIDTALKDIENGGSEENGVITIKNYVGSGNEIIGRSVIADGKTEFEAVTVRKGADIEYKLFMTVNNLEDLAIVASGKVDKNILNCDYTVTLKEDEIAKGKVTGYDINKAKDGLVNCTLTIIPNMDYIEKNTDADTVAALSLLNPTLEIKIEEAKNAAKLSCALLNGDKVFFGIDIDSTVEANTEITVPTENIINAENAEDMQSFVMDIDFQELINKLKATSVPDELVDMLVMAMFS